MFGTFDFIREIGLKIKGGSINQNGECERYERSCRSVLLQLPKAQPLDIEFKNINFTVTIKKEKKTLLKGVSGLFRSGELTAIMGPSGAGKSSLLNILTGFQTTGVSGTISNKKCGARSNSYKKESCYILQDDHLYPFFTVDEIMMIAANLKLGNNLSHYAKQTVIHNILETLGLVNTKSTKCAKLSGGQRKRLSIALELIDNPPVMFLDEPTTGLDSSSSVQVITMLKNLAKAGRTIICTIHQPSATLYEMFDHVYILAEGMCIYQGGSTRIVQYLNKFGLECPKYHNPADYVLEIANCEYGNFNDILASQSSTSNWRREFGNHSIDEPVANSDEPTVAQRVINEYKPSIADSCKATVLIQPPSELSKFWILLHRCVILQYRDWTVTHLKAVIHCIVGIFLGIFFTSCGSNGSKAINNIGFLMIGVVYLAYTSLMPAVLRFPQELLILKKENFNNWYKLRTYYAAAIICNLPIQFIFVSLYTSCSYFLSSQPPESFRFMMYLFTLLVTSLLAEAGGHIIGTLTNPITGTFFGAITICVTLLFAGFLALFSHMAQALYAISYLSLLRYSLESLVIAMYGFNREPLACPEDVVYCHLRNPVKLLEELKMSHVNYWEDTAVLVSSLIALKIIAFFTLRRNLRSS